MSWPKKQKRILIPGKPSISKMLLEGIENNPCPVCGYVECVCKR